jgi:hypothetical protein
VAAASVSIAVRAKLAATAAVTALVGARIYPQLNTQEPTFPQLVYTVLGAEGQSRLNGASQLKRWTVRIDCYAETEIGANALAKVVREALAPDSTPWTDSTNGVQGAFWEDGVTEFTEDGIRVQGETFGVWHQPT